jgi:hypothetical protein
VKAHGAALPIVTGAIAGITLLLVSEHERRGVRGGRVEDVGYVNFCKGRVTGRPRMWVALTRSGRKALTGQIEEPKRIAGLVTE